MRVHVHTLCWNDRPMLDFFFRHYDPWVDHYFIFDDGSDDGTLEYLQARDNVTVARTPRVDPDSWIASARYIYNNDWKRSIGQADWVVVTNIDEHLHHPNMRGYLTEMFAAGVTMIPALGYQMITDRFPEPESVLARDHTMGAPWPLYTRFGIFRPDRIRETNYGPGRHKAEPEGEYVGPQTIEVLNLHYKYLGVPETRARHKEQAARLGPGDVANGWGRKYHWRKPQLRAHFDSFRAELVDVSNRAYHRRHKSARAWARHGPKVGT